MDDSVTIEREFLKEDQISVLNFLLTEVAMDRYFLKSVVFMPNGLVKVEAQEKRDVTGE